MLDGSGCSLVYEVDVRTPNLVGRNSQNFNVVVLLWIPRQPVVRPVLGWIEDKQKEVGEKRKPKQNRFFFGGTLNMLRC